MPYFRHGGPTRQTTKDDEHLEIMNCSPAILRPDNCHDQATGPRQTFSAAAHIDCRAMPNYFLPALCPRSHNALRRMSARSEEHTSELQSQFHLVCRLLLEKKKKKTILPSFCKKKKKKNKK